MTRYSALRLLLGGYLHEDFDDDYPDVWVAVEDFVRSEPDSAPSVPDDIAHLLATVSAEEALGRVLHREVACAYYPPADGWTYRGWLEAIADRITKMLREKNSEPGDADGPSKSAAEP
jgi:hypothetical protein